MRLDAERRRRPARLRASGLNPGANRFQKEGEYWTIAYGDLTVRLRDRKGLQCLARLLGHPGERVSALLLGASAKEAAGTTTARAERARVTVTKHIKAAIKRIGNHHPSLGHHLATCVKTGHVCAYTPDPEQPVRWVL